jgi:hypothetical protein
MIGFGKFLAFGCFVLILSRKKQNSQRLFPKLLALMPPELTSATLTDAPSGLAAMSKFPSPKPRASASKASSTPTRLAPLHRETSATEPPDPDPTSDPENWLLFSKHLQLVPQFNSNTNTILTKVNESNKYKYNFVQNQNWRHLHTNTIS